MSDISINKNGDVDDINTEYREDPYRETVDKDGLSITVDEETDEITFIWNPETHPEWNYLEEVGKEELLKMMLSYLDVVSDADATTTEESEVAQ
jgi:hypothetical protein